ncbi:hypothetical protein FRB99_007719 [Tulasnella sp. 403]|nr:hypothetical protein FRB99_007719 [Tulasnella sp. 403]
MQLPLLAASLILVWHAALSRSAVLRTHNARAPDTCTPADLCPPPQIGFDGSGGVVLEPDASRLEWFDWTLPTVYCGHSDGSQCVYTYLPTENNDGYTLFFDDQLSSAGSTWCIESKRTVKTNCKMPARTPYTRSCRPPTAADECNKLTDEELHKGRV